MNQPFNTTQLTNGLKMRQFMKILKWKMHIVSQWSVCWTVGQDVWVCELGRSLCCVYGQNTQSFLISPYTNAAESFIKIMRIKEMISN